MVKIPHPDPVKQFYYMEPQLYENIKELPARIEKDKDCVGVFVGAPGEGKSTMAQQVLFPLDTRITCDSIKYSYEDYVNYCLDLFHAKPPGQSKGRGVIHDEGREVLSGGAMLTRRTRKFLNFLYENRQMNMYQFILTGDFFDLPRAIVSQRVLFMVWVHEGGEFENGYFKFYNAKRLRELYNKGKRLRNMIAAPASFSGRFPKFYTVDETEYRKIKKEHLVKERYLEDAADQEEIIKPEEVVFQLPKIK